MATPNQMDDKMKNFLMRFAEGEGLDNIRVAAEELLRRQMANPAYAKYLDEGDRVAVEAAAASEPVATPKKVTAPKAAAAPKAASPKATSPKAPAEDVRKTKPTSLVLDGNTIEATSWRSAFCALVEHVISIGRVDVVPPAWIKTVEDRTTSPLSNGQHLYTNHTGEQFLPKMRKLVAALSIPATITIEPNEGGASRTIAIAA